MMRWLTRLVHASGSARHFLKGSVIAPRSVMRPVYLPVLSKATQARPLTSSG